MLRSGKRGAVLRKRADATEVCCVFLKQVHDLGNMMQIAASTGSDPAINNRLATKPPLGVQFEAATRAPVGP